MLLDLDALEKRRQDLILKFTKNGMKNGTLSDLFPINEIHTKCKQEMMKYTKLSLQIQIGLKTQV